MKIQDVKTSKGITGGILILLIGLVVFTTALAGSITGFSIFSNRDNQVTGQQIDGIAPSCTTNAQCPSTQYCRASTSYGGARCALRRTNGLSCTVSDQCSSNVCNNGRCASLPTTPTTTSPVFNGKSCYEVSLLTHRGVAQIPTLSPPNSYYYFNPTSTPESVCRAIGTTPPTLTIGQYSCTSVSNEVTQNYYQSTDRSCTIHQLNTTTSVPEAGVDPNNICSRPLNSPFTSFLCSSSVGSTVAEPIAGDTNTVTRMASVLCCR
ncbi:MAG: hypothetical protein WC595_00820 [Candidatus Nanoarchaeia archaeon]